MINSNIDTPTLVVLTSILFLIIITVVRLFILWFFKINQLLNEVKRLDQTNRLLTLIHTQMIEQSELLKKIAYINEIKK